MDNFYTYYKEFALEWFNNLDFDSQKEILLEFFEDVPDDLTTYAEVFNSIPGDTLYKTRFNKQDAFYVFHINQWEEGEAWMYALNSVLAYDFWNPTSSQQIFVYFNEIIARDASGYSDDPKSYFMNISANGIACNPNEFMYQDRCNEYYEENSACLMQYFEHIQLELGCDIDNHDKVPFKMFVCWTTYIFYVEEIAKCLFDEF